MLLLLLLLLPLLCNNAQLLGQRQPNTSVQAPHLES
jgi:hypothetical protein